MIIISVVTLFASLAYARRKFVDRTIPPRLGLVKAYRVAESALADKLGEDAKAFHCLGGHASIVSDSPDGEWRFVFYSKKGDVREVVVFYDAKTTVIRESIETEF